MKVLHTIQGLAKSSGGPSTCTYNLIKGLRSVGVDAKVVAIDNADNIAIDDFIHYVQNDSCTPLSISRNFGRYLKEYVADYDLVHANAIWLWSSHQASVYAHKYNKPFVITPHGMLYPQALKVSSWKKKIVLPMFQRSDLEKANVIHATCHQEYEHIRNFGLKNPIAVIPNCIQVSGYSLNIRPTNEVRKIGFVGRINPYKNIDRLLEAWHKLGNATNNSELMIIGDGDAQYEHLLRKYVSDNNLGNVRFMGFLSGDRLSEAVSSLDFQVLPSKSENFGMVVPEALIHGVPVIASKGTPWSDLVQYNCGWWVDNDVDTLAETIKMALTLSEDDRLSMGDRGRDLVINNYSVESVAHKMHSLYAWLMNGGRKPDFVYLD